VVQHLIDSKTLSEAETRSLRDDKVADKKFKHLLTIITDHCNRKELKAFKNLIDILEDTGNIDVAQQLSLIYKERVRSSHLIYKFRVRTDLIYIYTFILITKLNGKEMNIKNKHIYNSFRKEVNKSIAT
jgi:hypothetical protein